MTRSRRLMTRRFLARLRDEQVKLENQNLLRELIRKKQSHDEEILIDEMDERMRKTNEQDD